MPANTTVLDISCKGRPRVSVPTCANDFAAAYLSVRQSETTATISSALFALQSKARALTTQISRLRAELAALPGSSPKHTTANLELGAANSQLSAVDTQVNQLVPELSSLQAPGNTLAGHVITPAILPTSPSSPRALLLLPSGLLAGLLIGLIIAFIAERRDNRVHAARDVERFLDLPVLLTVSAGKTKSRRALAAPWSRADREFAEFARHIAASLGNGKHVLLVAGTSAGSGGSAVAANLAVMLARTGADVALICTDPRMVTPRLLGIDGARGGRGLAEVLAGTTSAAEVALSPPGTTRLKVITAGATTAVLPGVEHDVVAAMLADLRLDSRFVIIEASAVGDTPGAFTLAEFADAAIVAIEENATRRSDVEDCLQRLDRLGTVALGAAVIPATPAPGSAPATHGRGNPGPGAPGRTECARHRTPGRATAASFDRQRCRVAGDAGSQRPHPGQGSGRQCRWGLTVQTGTAGAWVETARGTDRRRHVAGRRRGRRSRARRAWRPHRGAGAAVAEAPSAVPACWRAIRPGRSPCCWWAIRCGGRWVLRTSPGSSWPYRWPSGCWPGTPTAPAASGCRLASGSGCCS